MSDRKRATEKSVSERERDLARVSEHRTFCEQLKERNKPTTTDKTVVFFVVIVVVDVAL